jgi:sortase A
VSSVEAGPTNGVDETIEAILDELSSLEAGVQAAGDTEVTGSARKQLVRQVLRVEQALAELETAAASSGAVPDARMPDLRARLDAVAARVAAGPYPSALTFPTPQAAAPVRLRVASPARLAATSRVLTVVGLAALLFTGYEFLFTGLTEDRTQSALLTAFKRAIPTTTVDAQSAVPAEGSPVALLDIPRIGLHQVVVEGTTATDLRAGPGHLRNSSLPGEYGNSVLAGRRTTYGGPFRQVDQLKPGDSILVTTGQGSFVYLVTQAGQVPARKAAPFVATTDSRLTLMTSDPAYVASDRLVVVAALQGTPPVDIPNRPAVSITAADLGLASDPFGVWPALIWVQLLGVSVWLAWRLRTRLPGTVLVMFAVPILAALALLAFSSLDTILPGLL